MSSDMSSVKKILNSKYTAIVILLIISIGVYLNAIPNEFVYDDEDQVLKNPWIRDVKHIPEIFLTNVWAFIGKENLSNYYRPLMHIIYMIDYHIFGLKPWGFHLINILYHAGVSVLVFLIFSMLINQLRFSNLKPKTQNPTSNILNLTTETLGPAFIGALLFATHPIHTEAVTWIGGIPELSFTLFYLFSFYLYIKADGKWGKKIILSVIFFFLATLCKETALTLPALMLVYDYSFRKDTLPAKAGQASSPFSSKTFYHLLKRYFPYLIVSIIYFVLRTYALGGVAPIPKKHTYLSNYEYFINVFPLFTQYLEKLILPINMNAFYVFHPISSIFQWKGIIALTFTLGFVFLVYIFRRHKLVFLSLLWIVIPLLPVLYIPAIGENTFTDRYLYLPSVGFVILGALVIERISQLKALRQSRRLGIVIISILIILTGLYSIGTIKRNYIWRDEYSLWTDTVEKSPDGYLPHHNLGLVYSKLGKFDEAIKEYMTVLKLKPDIPETHNNLGNAYSKLGKFGEAIKEYTMALKLKPDYPEAHNNLGNAYSTLGKFDEAIKEYMIAIKLKPDYPEAHNNLRNAYSTLGKFDEAIKEYMIAIKLKSDFPELHYNLGNAYFEYGRFEDAIKEYMTAIKLKPDHSEAHNNLGAIYFRQGRLDEAMKEYMIALKLNSGYTEAYYNLGLIYFKQGRFDEAIKEYMAALKLNPDYIQVYNSLGKVYFNKGEIDKAIEHFQGALRLKADYLEAHYNLGLVYLKTGLRHKAEEEFKTALKLRPDFTPAREALKSVSNTP